MLNYQRVVQPFIDGWLVVWNIWIIFFHSVGNVISPTDFHSLHPFFRGLGWLKPPTRYQSPKQFVSLWDDFFAVNSLCLKMLYSIEHDVHFFRKHLKIF